MLLRAAEPLILRVRRFAYECQARARLRGRVAPGVQFVGPVTVEGEGLVDIGPGTRIGRRVFFETYGGARISIGCRVTINDGATLVAYEGIRIGDDTMIGEYTSVRDANHGIRAGIPVHDQPHAAAAIDIGADCWLGRGVIVTKGVALGDGAVVGANSVANRDVPANGIAAGVPAELKGERTP